MARITDQNRIDRLKQSTMKLVVEHGFGGASASLIAKDANVASGYFYMHYKGKYEMVNAILHEVYQELVHKFEKLTSNGSSFNNTIEKMIRHFFSMANEDPVKLKFLYVLTNDYSFAIDREMHEDIFKIMDVLVFDGHASGQLDKYIQQQDLYLIVIINTIQYINQYYKNSPKEVVFKKKDEDHLIYLVNKILK
ncbi:MAG TPA: TetR/AcrR family transcriptional regulator [Prolixibacteraceae bacterium]|nr:TetR/AcrR family transcriptional regulator [Prolixibacteraceae bacterium]